MLKAEEEGREIAIDVEGPRSPSPYESDKQQRQQQKKEETTKRLHFNMSSIQIIPSNRQGQLNTAYLKTLPGLFKMAQVILAFVIHVLAIFTDRRRTTAAWTENVAFASMIIVSMFIIGYVIFPHLTIKNEATREGLIVVELIFYGVATVFFFIAIWSMIYIVSSRPIDRSIDGRGPAILAASDVPSTNLSFSLFPFSILCVAITILFAIETFHKLKAWKAEIGSSYIINNATDRLQKGGRDTELA